MLVNIIVSVGDEHEQKMLCLTAFQDIIWQDFHTVLYINYYTCILWLKLYLFLEQG